MIQTESKITQIHRRHHATDDAGMSKHRLSPHYAYYHNWLTPPSRLPRSIKQIIDWRLFCDIQKRSLQIIVWTVRTIRFLDIDVRRNFYTFYTNIKLYLTTNHLAFLFASYCSVIASNGFYRIEPLQAYTSN